MFKKLIVLTSFVLVLAVTGVASADEQAITVPDAGFDDHVLDNVGDWIYVGDEAYTGAWKSAGGDAWIDYGYYAGDGDLPALSGNNKLYPYESTEDYIYQILDETFIEGAEYTLSVWVGEAWEGYDDNWSLYFTGDDYTDELASIAGNGPIGEWGQASLVYTATAADAGKKIGIKMTGAVYVTFEDVTLSISTPEPVTVTVDMEIGIAMQPPVLDGEVDEIWAGASVQSFVPLEDPANGSGTWKALYDAENLYVIVDVTDDSLQNDSDGSWQDDSVEIYFDGGNTKLSTPLSGDDHQYTFGWTTEEIQGTNIDGYTEGIEHAQVDTDTGWRIEIKMPWLSIQGALPQACDLIGIDCYYNDDDDGGDSREGKMLGFSAVEGWNDASQWGTAVLGIIPEPVDPGTDGLVAYYALENDTNDSSGNDLHGTIVGNGTFVEGPAGYGMAMEFDGETYVDCSNDPRLDIPGPFAGSIWIRPDTLGGPDSVAPLCKAGLGWSWQLRFAWGSGGQDDVIGWQFNAPEGSTWIYVGQVLPVGEWYHVAASHDGETVRCYLDGEETDSAPMTAINSSPSSLLIGSEGWGFNWIGAIDEVALYDRNLSDDEVLYLAGFRSTVETDSSLVIYYSFDEVGDIVADQSGKGHDGIVIGDVTAEANGMYNGAANFANGGYLDLDGPSIPAEDIPTSAITLAAWIKCANTGGDHEIFSARASDESWLIHPEPKSSGDIRWLLRSYGGTTIFQIRAGTMTWDEWLHFAGTYDKESGKAALYINGELIEELVVENPADVAGDWGLGARVGLTIDDGRPFTGLMDEFRMYTRALSQDEIMEIMQGM